MIDTKLADKLRAWVRAEECRMAASDAAAPLRDEASRSGYPTVSSAAAYLRGYDDAQAESAANFEMSRNQIDALAAEVEKWKGQYYAVADAVARESTGVVDLCRKARQTREDRDALTARVRELEAQIAAQPQPAAVGVVGAVRWGVLEVGDHMISRVWGKRVGAEHYRHSYPHTGRVVAIVDADALVPLASVKPVQFAHNWTADDLDTTRPLYRGLAQALGEEG